MSVGADKLYVFPVRSTTIAESMYELKTFGTHTQQRAVVVCFKCDVLHHLDAKTGQSEQS